jgi:type I restriction enzyme M protein
MAKKNNNGKKHATQQSVDQAVKSICDIMRRGNCAGALQYVPELTWILFLRILDLQDRDAQAIAMMNGETTMPALPSPYRWCDWAAPHSDKPGHPQTPEGKPEGWKRNELFAAGDGKLFAFINTELLPFLHAFATAPTANTRQRVIGQIMTSVERVRVDSEGNRAMCLTACMTSTPRTLTTPISSPSRRYTKTCC